MSLSLSPAHLRRYRDVVALLIKYGRGDLVKDSPIVDDPLPYADAPPVPAKRPPPSKIMSPKITPATGLDLLLRPPQAAAPKGRLLGSTSAFLPKPFAGPSRARPPPRRSG